MLASFTAIILTFIAIPNIYVHGKTEIKNVLDGYRSLIPRAFKTPTMGIEPMYHEPNPLPGKVGIELWAIWNVCPVDCIDMKNLVHSTVNQIIVARRVIDGLKNILKLVDRADEIKSDFYEADKAKVILGLSEDYSISSNLKLMEAYYHLGIRSISLTSYCKMSRTVKDDTLTSFGEVVVKEANRLGMLIDVSSVSKNVRKKVMEVSRAPVIFAHSAYSGICNHTWNVDDDILELVKDKKKGLIMIPFHPKAIVCEDHGGSIDDVIKHITTIAKKVDDDQIGISGYFGRGSSIDGLEDSSKYPDLFEKLEQSQDDDLKWDADRLNKLASENFIKVFHDVEEVSRKLESDQLPSNPPMGPRPHFRSMNSNDCW